MLDDKYPMHVVENEKDLKGIYHCGKSCDSCVAQYPDNLKCYWCSALFNNLINSQSQMSQK